MTKRKVEAQVVPPSTNPADASGVWIWVPIVRDPDVSKVLAEVKTRLDKIMAQVKVNQEDLDSLQTNLSTIADDLETELQALNVPAGDLAGVQAIVDRLRSDVAVPAPVTPPEEPTP